MKKIKLIIQSCKSSFTLLVLGLGLLITGAWILSLLFLGIGGYMFYREYLKYKDLEEFSDDTDYQPVSEEVYVRGNEDLPNSDSHRQPPPPPSNGLH